MPYTKKRPPLDFCPIEAVVALVGGRWKARLLAALANGSSRLGALERAIPRAPRQVLIAQLEAMADDGLITIEQHAVGRSPYRTYTLSARGREMHALLAPLAAWAIENAVA